MSRINHKKIFFALVLAFLASGAFTERSRAAAPVLYLDAPSSVAAGQEFPVRVLIDAPVPLNAFNVVLRYQDDYLSFLRFNDANSLIAVWQRQPALQKDAVIQFSGGSFKPFQGERGELLTVYFKAEKSGAAEFAFLPSSAYIADGKGTEVIPDANGISISIGEKEPGSPAEKAPFASDVSPPEIRTVELAADPFNSSQNFVVFRAADSGSGVKETLVRTRTYFFWSEWRPVSNPAPVSGSAWAVHFKASDNAGNSAERILYDWNAFGWLFAKAAALLAFLFFIALAIIRRHAKKLLKMV